MHTHLSNKIALLVTLLLGFGILAVACSPVGATPPAPVEAQAASEKGAAVEHGSHLPPETFFINVEPIGHWHAGRTKTLLFTVTRTDDDTAVEGLNLLVQIVRSDSSRVTERTVENEQVIDEGDGIYSLEYTASALDSYSLVARFMFEGQEFVSSPVAFEVVRDGEEGIAIEDQATGAAYVYQIRYNWDPGHIHANDDEPATLVFEIMRGVPEGADINWEQPWQNTFDHITDAQNAVIMVESENGAIVDELPVMYRGKGIYQAERLFSVAEVGEGLSYDIRFLFTDPYNGAEVTHSEPYPLRASPAH